MLVGNMRKPGFLPTLVSMNTALKTLGLRDRRAVIRLVQSGKIAGRKVGSLWRLNRESLREYCDKNPRN